ncbi:UBN2 domain-containing protein [Cephalotus follicularis]|uniref:UBN2 domain-containing protein n=1 Tax=Cephalotus follicularis TaxID=3775 RepID=A0A1Q3DAX9_CEPFO|nr:UBN2 domain-containing protein [Cephalotus follicularis]
MHDNDSVSDMFTRFTTIINSLKNLGKSYSNQELLRKILRCLPKSWTPKVTTIEEAKDLSTLPLEQLLGSLMTHETTMKNHENVEVKKKKTIALKALRKESESDEDDDIVLISKQFKKFLKSQKEKRLSKRKSLKMKNRAKGKNRLALSAKSRVISRTNARISKRKKKSTRNISRKRMSNPRRRKQW